jgi:hypothetical protein
LSFSSTMKARIAAPVSWDSSARIETLLLGYPVGYRLRHQDRPGRRQSDFGPQVDGLPVRELCVRDPFADR